MAVSTIDPNGLNVGQLGGDKNVLINGNFAISQRGDYTTASSITNGEFFVDRWYIDIAGINGTKQQTTGLDITGAPVIGNGAKLVATSTSGSAYIGMRQKVENPTQYVGRTLTYSGYVRSNSSNARLSTFISGTDQTVTSDPHTGDGTWQKLSVTFTMTGNPTTAWFIDAFIIGASYANVSITSGDYIEVAFLQMELGDTATDFSTESVGTTLQKCKRYFQKFGNLGGYDIVAFGGIAPYTTQVQAATVLSPEMRIAPALTSANIAAADTLNPQVTVTSTAVSSGTHNNKIAWVVYYTSGSLTAFRPYYLRVDGTSTGHISFDAEL